MFTGILGFALVSVVLLTFTRPGRRLLKAIGVNLSAQTDRAAESIANADPLGAYKTAIANSAENGSHASKIVETAAKQLISLDNQITNGVKEQTRLTNRLKTVVANGDPNKTAAQYAKDLARVEADLKANQAQRDSAQSQYDDNLALVRKFEKEVADARKDAASLGFQLEQSEAEKNLVQMSASLKNQLATGDFATARQRVQDAINANRGSVKAQHDLNSGSAAEELDDQLENDAEVAAVLARFQAPQTNNQVSSVSAE